MARLRFTPGTRYVLEGAVYLVRQALPQERVVVENHTSGGQLLVPLDDLVAAWTTGRLAFEVGGPHARESDGQSVPTTYPFMDLEALAPEQRTEAWRRYSLLQPLLALPAAARTRAALARYAASTGADGGRGGRRASLERWLRAFLASGQDIRALVPARYRSGARGQGRLGAEREALVSEVLAACAAAPRYRTTGDVYLLVLNRIAEVNKERPAADRLGPPSPRTIQRRIVQADAPAILRRVSRADQQATRPVGAGPTPVRILERVEIDHTVLDVILVDATDRRPIGRPTLTQALDVYSGFPLGCYVGFEPPSYRTVQSCLLHAILPKEDVYARYGTQHPWPAYGLPETLVVDNGPEFRGRDLADACAQLGITLEHTPVRQPWYKGSIERYFRTHNTGLVHTLPGTTAAVGGDDPAGQACLTLEAFWRLLHIFLLDIYAERFHTGVGGIPARRWAQSRAAGVLPCLPTSAEEVRILLGRTATRTLRRTGIDFASLRYQSAELAPLQCRLPPGATLRIKYDPADLSALHVYDATPPGRWLRVPALDQAYTQGLSLWAHRLIRAHVLQEKGSVDPYALAAAKAQIAEVVTREYTQTRRQRRRKTAARLLERDRTAAPTLPVPDPAIPTPSAAREPAPPLAALASEDIAACLAEPGWGVDYGLPRDLRRGPWR